MQGEGVQKKFQWENSPVTHIEWSSDIELGHTEIDEQHKRLLMLGEDLAETPINPATNKPSDEQLQALIEFAQKHFTFEESLMRSTGYPGVAEHANFHNTLLAQLRTYCFRTQRGMHTDPVALNSFFGHWIVPHIGSEDRDLVTWIKSRVPDDGR